jgi:RecB family exonuclease
MLKPVRALQDVVAFWVSGAPAAPIPVRTVLVSSERLAHAFRRELATRHAHLLAGTRFVAPTDFAAELLLLAGRPLLPGAERIRPIALESLFASEKLAGRLKYLDLEGLRRGSGSAEAVAATIDDCSAAGLDSAALIASPSDRAKDLGTVWSLLPIDLSDRHSILRAATPLAPAWKEPVFVLLETDPSPSLEAFVAPFDGARLDPDAEGEARSEGELALLQAQFLKPPGGKRERSKSIDGTVHLEVHAGVDEELRAATDWVAGQVRAKVSLERVAIFAPETDPWLGMLHDRLAGLPWPADAPIYVAGGLPVRERPAGMRFLALIDALSAGLRVQELLRVIPSLKVGESHLSPGQALALVSGCGTIGGSPVDLKGAEAWLPGLERRRKLLEKLCALDPVPERLERQVEEAKRALEPTLAMRPALETLVSIARRVAGDAPLAELAAALLAFWKTHVRSIDNLDLATHVEEKLKPLLDFDRRGSAALAVIRRAVDRLRVPVGRFGEPRIFLGTATQAAGLPFDAVRFVGLAEAGAPADDPLLPNEVRVALSPSLPTSADKARRSLRDLRRAVLHASRSVVFSAPRQNMEDTVCEASTLFLEAALALGRHTLDAKLDARVLREAYISPGREALAKARYLEPNRLATSAPDPLVGNIGRPLELKPQSPSRLKTFWECPHHYLLEHVLHWKEPDAAPDAAGIDALTYGSLVHSILEDCGREKLTLEAGIARASERFEELIATYPLSAESRTREKRRLEYDVRRALKREKDRGTELLEAEKPFGWKEPLQIAGLPVHGYIDRIDASSVGQVVRDYKTGKAKDEKPPNPVVDLQIGVYALAQGGSVTGAEYAYVSDRHTAYRDFKGDGLATLLRSTEAWLSTAKSLMEAGLFPKTANKDGCKYCSFEPLCGRRPWERSPQVWKDAAPVQAFFALQAAEDDDDAE